MGGLMPRDIPYFSGVRIGIGNPLSVRGVRWAGMRLKCVFLDSSDDYACFWINSGEQALHDYMMEFILSVVNLCGSVFVVARGDSSRPYDLKLKNCLIEVETGLKRSFTALIRRLATYNEFCFVVVPNVQQKAHYKARLGSFHGRVVTLRDFASSFKC